MAKKICLFFGHYDPARQTIMDYYEKIFPKDVNLTVACASRFDRERYKIKAPVIEFLDRKFIVPFKLRRFCRKNKIDLVVNYTGQAEVSMTLFLATVFSRTKSIFYFLGNPRLNLKNLFFLFSQFFHTRILASGKEVTDKIKKYLFFSRSKIDYLAFPINVHIFKKKNKNVLRKKISLKQDDKVLLYVGRIEPAQGSDYLLELVMKNPDKKFIFIGEIKDTNFKNKKFKNVLHIPYIFHDDLVDYYSLSDLTLFLSKRNSYPYPPRESLACGVPVILFDLNTFGQLKTRAVKKFPFDIKKIQEEIDNFFSLSKNEREKLGKEGREFIIRDSSEEKLKEKTLELLSFFN